MINNTPGIANKITLVTQKEELRRLKKSKQNPQT